MADYKPGDVVTLEHEDGSRLVRTVKAPVNDPADAFVPTGFGNSILRLCGLGLTGWRVTDHKPKIELPTEPGAYHDGVGDLWVLSTLHNWTFDGLVYGIDDVATNAPFTRLVPEGSEREAAIREVIAYYESMQYHDGYLAQHKNARRKFGITE